MTKADLIAALGDIPDDAEVRMEVGGESVDFCEYTAQTYPGDDANPPFAVLMPELDPVA